MNKFKLLLIICIFSSNMSSILVIKSSKAILENVQQYLSNSPVIVEAGAYDGTDTLRMATLWPNSTIHSFEPDPRNFEPLINKTMNVKNINIYPFALSNMDGFAIFYQASNLQSGSLLSPKKHLIYAPKVKFNEQVEVSTLTLDSWANKYGVDHVDFLWLDMQGAELLALKAAPNILKTVKVIYTEVEFVEAYKEQYLYNDVKKWLEEQGFTLIAQDFQEKDINKWTGNILMARINKS